MDPIYDARSEALRTAVLVQAGGIGDLLWHLPYLEAIAAGSAAGRVTLVAAPSTLAPQLVEGLPWIEAVLPFDRRPRAGDGTRGRDAGLAGLWRMAKALHALHFDRWIVFGRHANRALLGWLADIPVRQGYGTSAAQRLWLNWPPHIRAYEGPSVPVFRDAAAFAVAQGWADGPVPPRLPRRDEVVQAAARRLAGLPRPFVALAIGSSEPRKQWGVERFAALATGLRRQGLGVLLLGGPGETAMAEAIAAAVPAALRDGLRSQTREPLQATIGALWLAAACVGNDTGATQLAAACGRPAWVLLGPRPLLDWDPALRLLRAPSLDAITVDAVLAALQPVLAVPAACAVA